VVDRFYAIRYDSAKKNVKTEVRMNKAKKYFKEGYGVNGYALPFLTPLALY
jgi:hypothetical protein